MLWGSEDQKRSAGPDASKWSVTIRDYLFTMSARVSKLGHGLDLLVIDVSNAVSN